MFCCFIGFPASQPKRLATFSDLTRSPGDEARNSSGCGEPGKAAALLELVTTAQSERPTKASHTGVNGVEAVNRASLEREGLPTEPSRRAHGIWASLVEGLRTNTGKQLPGIGSAAAPSDGHTALRLPPAGSMMSLPDLIQQMNGLRDPVALVAFERTSKRTVRSQRISPHLVMDINMEAMFAGGLVSPPCIADPSSEQQSLEPSGQLPMQAVLHLLQRSYCNAEGIRLSVHHTNSALQSLLGCPGVAEYESLLADLLSTENMMRAVLHDSCLCMLEGVTASSAQLMVHHPIHNTPSRMVLPILLQPVLVWRRPGCAPPNAPEVPTMALVVRYTLSSGMHDALQQLDRVYAMLSSLSGIVTLFTLRGKVLHQNTASVRYMGLRTDVRLDVVAAINNTAVGGAGTDIHQSTEVMDGSGLAVGSLLRQIFALSSDQLDDMLEDVVDGKTWKGIVRVPPLLTPTTDPGPAQPAVLMARGMSAMTAATPNGSNAQVLSTWERLGSVFMSTQPAVRRSVAQNGNQSDAEGHSDMVGALMMTQTDADKSNGGPADGPAAIRVRMGSTTGNGGVPPAAVGALRANASTLGGGPGSRIAGPSVDTVSTPDSCIFLAMGSTSGTTFSRMNNTSHLATQTSSVRMTMQQRPVMSRLSSDLPEGGTLAAALSTPGGGSSGPPGSASNGAGTTPTGNSSGGGGGGTIASNYVASKLSGSAPVVPSNPRAQSAVRVAGTSLLRTLMENGASIVGEMDRASSNIGLIAASAGSSGNLAEDYGRRRQPHGLTDAVRRSIVRRRSALKMVPSTSDDNPLSTSTWGLFDNHRNRGESKSFTLRRNNSPTGPHGVKHVGTERQLEQTVPTQSQTELQSTGPTAASLNSGGGSAKKRPPSRLMSFLANKNIAGAPVGTGHLPRSFNLGGGNQVWSTSVVSENGGSAHGAVGAPDGSVGGVGGGGMLKGMSSTTELELGSRQGSSLGRSGLSVLTMPHPAKITMTESALSPAVPVEQNSSRWPGNGNGNFGGGAVVGGGGAILIGIGSALQTGSQRRPPTRRILRPAIEDVAEESGPECSSRLPLQVAAARDSGSSAVAAPAALPHLSAVMQASRISTSSQGTSRMPTTGQLNPSQAPGASERGSASPGEDDDDDDCWHEITASALRDPVSGEQALLLMQVDVSARVRAERRIAEVLEAEHKLLESVFPRHVLELAATRYPKNGSGKMGVGTMSKFSLAELPLAQNCASVATYHPMVTILFSDIIGFTSMCHEIPATKVMEFLNNLYSRLDTLLDVYGVYKVETIGDCYMVAGGLMTRDADGFMTVRGSDTMDELHAAKVMSFAKAMLRETSEVLLPTTGEPVQMRIGLHSGPVMSGIVGSKMPRFCLFGDTVNTASRMESTCPPGSIHVSSSTREFLMDEDWEPMGGVMVKGKGVMETFRWIPWDSDTSPQVRVTGGQRHNRPRRASSIAYIHTAAGGGGGGGGGGGAQSRDGSGNISLAQQSIQAVGSGPSGLPSGTGFTAINSGNGNAIAQSSVPGCQTTSSSPAQNVVPPKGYRAASANITFMSTLAVAPTIQEVHPASPSPAISIAGHVPAPQSARSRATGFTSSGPGSAVTGGVRRKPHRSSSTTALAYKGLARPT